MKKLEKIKVKGKWVPSFVIWIKGFIHGRKRLVVLSGVDNKEIKSPYLLERQYAFIEYKEKLFKETERQLLPLKENINKEEMEKSVNKNNLYILELKLEDVKFAITGNECRAKLKMEKNREDLERKIAVSDSKITELNEKIDLLEKLSNHLFEQSLANEKSSAYVYVTGAQRGLKNNDFYLNKEDYVNELYSNVLVCNG